MCRIAIVAGATLGLGFVLSASSGAGAAVFTEAFTGASGQPTGWTSSAILAPTAGKTAGSGSTFALTGTGRYQNNLTSGNDQESLNNAGFLFNSRSSGTDFTITTHVSNSTGLTAAGGANSWNAQMGVRLLATSAIGVNASTDSYYEIKVSRNNNAEYFWQAARRVNGAATALFSDNVNKLGFMPFNNAAVNNYTLTVVGDYQTNGDLWLSATFTDGVNTSTMPTQIQAATIVGRPGGDYFGVMSRVRNFSGGTVNMGASFDDYSIQYQPVPEPASLGLLGMGGLMLRRRRRA